MKRQTIRSLLLFFMCVQFLHGQSATILEKEINRLVGAKSGGQALANSDEVDSAIEELADNAIKVAVAARDKKMAEKLMSFRRADVQFGAGNQASGSTSAVLNPLLPAVFGFSFETGGITKSVSGNIITLTTNPAGLMCASSAGSDVAERVERRDADVCKTFWKRFGLSASFDAGRGSKDKDLANLQAISSQFSDLSVRVELLNHRTSGPLKSFIKQAKTLANEVAEFHSRRPDFKSSIRNAIQSQLNDSGWAGLSSSDRAGKIADAIDAAVKSVANDTGSIGSALIESLTQYSRAQSNRAVISFEYGYQQPDLATEAIGTDPIVVPKGIRPPNLHSARLIYAQGISSRNLDLTANISGSWFDEVRPGMSGNFRDFRAGIEAKFKLREIANYGAPTLSFAGLYMYLHQRPLGLGIEAFNQADINARGNIGLFQAKLEFPTANNNIRIPVSFTYSNRTELIKESDVRGQIGISFNMGSLFGEKK
jgi:hypothetical protein